MGFHFRNVFPDIHGSAHSYIIHINLKFSEDLYLAFFSHLSGTALLLEGATSYLMIVLQHLTQRQTAQFH